jgi:hypothetical protein
MPSDGPCHKDLRNMFLQLYGHGFEVVMGRDQPLNQDAMEIIVASNVNHLAEPAGWDRRQEPPIWRSFVRVQ